MRRVFWILALLIFLLTSCVAKRGVKNHTFYSTYPKVAIEISPELEYVDHKNTKDSILYPQSYFSRFLFADMFNKKVCDISFHQLGSYQRWVKDITIKASESGYISSGYEDHMGKLYQYVVMVKKSIIGECRLLKWMVMFVGVDRNLMFAINYSESLSGKIFSCENKDLKLEDLSVEQRKIYDTFMENSNKNMKFVNIESLNLESSEPPFQQN